MYYSFYMNERMLLDNWKYYQEKGECNWLLKKTLMNDDTRTPAEKLEFYLANRRVVNEYSEELKEQAEQMYAAGGVEGNDKKENYLDTFYIDYDIKNVLNRGQLNKYMNYLKFKERSGQNLIEHMNRKPKHKLRENTVITIYQDDLKFIREIRKYYELTVPQIEILFGLIFFCRMNGDEKTNLSTEFRKKQFIGCFKRARIQDFDYIIEEVDAFRKTDDSDYIYYYYDVNKYSKAIKIDVTLRNNKLDLTKMAHKYIPDILDKRYCEMCLHPFEPTSNRQKVCKNCKKKADAIKANYRKIKQRYKEANGEDACCGKCTDCIKTDCMNWLNYWFDEFSYRCSMYKEEMKYPYPRCDYTIPKDEEEAILDKMIYDIQYVMTDEEKERIIPWDISNKYIKHLKKDYFTWKKDK